MIDPGPILILAATVLAGLALASLAALRAWRGWLELRRLELTRADPRGDRSDLKTLRARIRRLETIAEGGR